jgi:hypothetical protein
MLKDKTKKKKLIKKKQEKNIWFNPGYPLTPRS